MMQLNLFDTFQFYGRRLKSHAAARNDIGDVAEIFACQALKMDRQSVDGRKKVCVDATWGGRPVEIKSVGKNNRGIVYQWRMAKDLTEHKNDMLYCFVSHDCPITVPDSSDIVHHFKEQPPSLILVTMRELHGVLKDIPVRKFSLFFEHEGPVDTRIGYNRAGYSEGGWQFSLSLLQYIGFALKLETSITWSGKQIPLHIKASTGALTMFP